MKKQNVVTTHGKELPQTNTELLDAIGFDTYSYAFKNDQFKDVVSVIFEEVKPKLKMNASGSSKYKKYRDCVRHIIFNVYFGYAVDLPIKYGRRCISFQAGKQYGLHWFTYRTFIRAMDALIQIGYLDGVTGYYDRKKEKKEKGMRSRYQATDKLKSLFDSILSIQVAERLPRKNSIILKDDEKNGIDLSSLADGMYDVNMTEFKIMAKNLNLYNQMASKQLVLLPLENVTVTHDFLFKLRLQMSRGMVDIYDFNEQNESGFNFNESITYLKNTYINNNNNNHIHNIKNNNSNKLYGVVGQLLLCYFVIYDSRRRLPKHLSRICATFS